MIKCRALSDCLGMYGLAAAGVSGRALCGSRPALDASRRIMRKATVGRVSMIEVSAIHRPYRQMVGGCA